MSETKLYNIIHLRPNDIQAPEFDHNRIRSQIRAFLIPDLIIRHHFEYANYYSYEEFQTRYEGFMYSLQVDPEAPIKAKLQHAASIMHWSPQQVFLGNTFVWLKYEIWKELEDNIRAAEKEDRARAKEAPEDVLVQDQDFMYEQQNMGHRYMDAPDMQFGDNESFAYTEDKREIEGSQWGEESEWGITGLAEG
jgi:chitin synthase